MAVDVGLGDDDKRREGSTGGKSLFGFGDRWWTWEAICAPRSWLDNGLLVPEALVGLLMGVESGNWGVLRKSGLHGPSGFHDESKKLLSCFGVSKLCANDAEVGVLVGVGGCPVW